MEHAFACTYIVASDRGLLSDCIITRTLTFKIPRPSPIRLPITIQSLPVSFYEYPHQLIERSG